ncbi:MAG: glycoside hydrolase family 26 protein [Verrucomicrobia bacterium]|nr:glycoside hydrolase family 26 protein [Verrucomicrobiota bacterium]
MKYLLKIVYLLLFVLSAFSSYSVEPINPDATDEARAVLKFLNSIQGDKTLAGQHVIYGDATDREIGYIFENTGKRPALVEFEGGIFAKKYSDDYYERQDRLVEEAIEYWKKGGLIAICWHWGNPMKPRNTYQNTKVEFDIKASLREGTPEHEALIKDLDVTARMLKKLRDAGVPVLWRPLHEICGGWFWWSKQGKDPAQALWKFIYEYYTGHHNLNNLLWVYSASQEMRNEWFPGHEYADVIGVDIYREGEQDELANFNKMAAIAGDKPVALTECDHIPDPDVMAERGFLWNWFLPWHSRWLRSNEPEYLKRVYNHELVITLDEMPEVE